MDIDTQSLLPLAAAVANATADSAQGDARREQWLSELEKESFAVSDESLPSGVNARMEPPALRLDDPQAPAAPARAQDPFAVAAELAAFAGRLAPTVASLTPGAPLAPRLQSASMPEPRGLDGWQISTLASNGSRSPDAASLRLAQRYDALMNQLRFTDLNVRVTQSAGELTLWIRDFKQKYAVEVFNWVRDLQGLLAEQGNSLSRIMVNGKRISHVNELMGGSQWL